MGTRRKARECALQMLFAKDVTQMNTATLTQDFWNELGDDEIDESTREFANKLTRTQETAIK